MLSVLNPFCIRKTKRADVLIIGSDLIYSIVLAKKLSDKGLSVALCHYDQLNYDYSSILISQVGAAVCKSLDIEVPTTKDPIIFLRHLLKTLDRDKVIFYGTEYKVVDLQRQERLRFCLRRESCKSDNLVNLDSICYEQLGCTDNWLTSNLMIADLKNQVIEPKLAVMTSQCGFISGIAVEQREKAVHFTSMRENVILAGAAEIQVTDHGDKNTVTEGLSTYLSSVNSVVSVIYHRLK